MNVLGGEAVLGSMNNTSSIALDSDLKPVGYAWAQSASYPVLNWATDGYSGGEFILCPKCAAKAKELDCIIIDQSVHWEGEPAICEECSEMIESAYGEVED